MTSAATQRRFDALIALNSSISRYVEACQDMVYDNADPGHVERCRQDRKQKTLELIKAAQEEGRWMERTQMTSS